MASRLAKRSGQAKRGPGEEAAQPRPGWQQPPPRTATPATVGARVPAPRPGPTGFLPKAPKTLEGTGINLKWLEGLVAKLLLDAPGLTGFQISRRICLAHAPTAELLDGMKQRRLVARAAATRTGDFKYELSDAGKSTALDARKASLYVGPAPVSLDQYLESVAAQSVARARPKKEELDRSMKDLILAPGMLEQLGPAIASGRALFLYGPPGNGKTSIAERLIKTFGSHAWIPHAVEIDGYIVKLLDPHVHDEDPLPDADANIDRRWVRCKRPCVVVGGELTLDDLDMTFNSNTGVCDSPVQMKANCGILVVDDFGRQRARPEELLNRWIVPLERQIDYVGLPNGRRVAVPFDPMVVFSTNLNPSALVDDAFLRRIPYKVLVEDPTEPLFRQLLHVMCKALDVEPSEQAFDYLISVHYGATGRPFRFCHPRDILSQIRDMAKWEGQPARLTREYIDRACRNYFIARAAPIDL